MIVAEVGNNVTRLVGVDKSSRKELNQLYEAFKVRNPNAYFLRQHMPKGWDGKKEYLTKMGTLKTGLLPLLVEKCKAMGIEIQLDDQRRLDLLRKPIFKRDLKGEYAMRGKYSYQGDLCKTLKNNMCLDIPFQRGGGKIATNGGKTSISAGIYNMWKEPTIFLMNSRELFEQALKDMPKLLNCSIGQISSKKIEWADFMICMVATMRNRLKQIKQKLSTYKVLIVDEGDLVDNKTNKTVIQTLFNTVVRVQLSGTLEASKLKQDLIHNMNVMEFFGPIFYEVTNKDLIDKGVSSNVEVTFIEGNTDRLEDYSYPDQVELGIVKNKQRNRKIIERVKYHISQGRKNQLIIAQRHKHIKRIYNRLIKANLGLTIDWVHHSRKDRFEVVDKFQDGKIDILVGSMILKRGKNFPRMNYMLNAGGGKSPANILQLLGRAFRGCKHYEDFWDQGLNLKRHSRRRAIYYTNEKIKVINQFK